MKNILYTLMAVAVVAFVGCDKGGGSEEDKSIQSVSSDQTLHYDDEFQIQATSITPITYTSENEYHAEVSTSGLVTAGRVGETIIVLTNGEDTKKIKITVTPESNLYPEPELTFGMSRSAVKAKYGTPLTDTSSGMGYTGYSDSAPMLLCLFDASDKLTTYGVVVKTAYSSQLGVFLSERYVLMGIDNDDYLLAFVNGLDQDSVTMGIAASVYSTAYWQVTYSPYTLSSRSAQTVDHLELKKLFDELIGNMK
jgi:hypothetical protein